MILYRRGLLRRGTNGAADPPAPPAPARPAPPRVTPVPPRGGGTTTVWERQVVPGRYQIHKKLGGFIPEIFGDGFFCSDDFLRNWNSEGFLVQGFFGRWTLRNWTKHVWGTVDLVMWNARFEWGQMVPNVFFIHLSPSCGEWDWNIWNMEITMSHQKPIFLEVFMVNHLVCRWPKHAKTIQNHTICRYNTVLTKWAPRADPNFKWNDMGRPWKPKINSSLVFHLYLVPESHLFFNGCFSWMMNQIFIQKMVVSPNIH